MSKIERQLREDRLIRDAARAVFDARLARLRQGVADKGIGARVADEALGRARATADQTLAVAKDNRLIVAATLAALAAWFLRKPLGRWLARIADGPRFNGLRDLAGEPASHLRRLRDWAVRKGNT